MTKKNTLDQLKKKNDGTMVLKDATAAGVSKTYFYSYIEKLGMVRSGRGVYQTKDTWVDDFALLQRRCPEAVFSHDTALFFHDLTDREPHHLSVTVKTGYNPHRLKKDGVIVYSIKEGLLDLGSTVMTSPYGNSVKVYDVERTICDVIRSRNRLETDAVLNAVKQYAKRRDKDIHKLMKYAADLHVDKIVRHYLEVLL